MKIRTLLCAALTLVPGTMAMATAPVLINYQGVLTDAGGDPIVATTAVTFSIWATATGGTPAWTEAHSVLPDSSGRFNVILGTFNAIPPEAWDNPDTWLEVSVVDEIQSPRQRLVSVPYSVRVNSVEGAAGGAIGSDVSVVGNVVVEGTLFADAVSSNSPLELQTAGTTRMYLDDVTGNVGINTESPSSPLHVAGDLRIDGQLLGVTTPWTGLMLFFGYDNLDPAHPGGNHPLCEYRRVGDVVELRGLLHSAFHGVVGGVVALLPAGFWPPKNIRLLTHGNGGAGVTVEVRADGLIEVLLGTTEWISLNGISFSVTP